MSATPIFDEVLRARRLRIVRSPGDAPGARAVGEERHRDRPVLRLVAPDDVGRHAHGRVAAPS